MKRADPGLATPTLIMGSGFILISLSQFFLSGRPEIGVVFLLGGAFILWIGIRLKIRGKKSPDDTRPDPHE